MMPVIFPEFAEEVEFLLDEATARADDALWMRYVKGQFSWQRFINWWVSRRWVMPRDVRRQ